MPAVLHSIRLVEVIHFFHIAQLFNNSVAVLNTVRSSERKSVTIERAAGNTSQSNNENSGELDELIKTFTSAAFKKIPNYEIPHSFGIPDLIGSGSDYVSEQRLPLQHPWVLGDTGTELAQLDKFIA